MESRKSISGGVSLPQWMQKRLNERLEIDESTFSPSQTEDNFFYIKYPRRKSNANVDPVTENNTTLASLDIANHTESCRNYILGHNVQAANVFDSNGASTSKLPNKSQGTDDGFHGIGAACGMSILKVAQKMVGSGKVIHGFNPKDDDIATTTNVVTDYNGAVKQGFNPKSRRGSRSLPASPLSSPKGSPKLVRKFSANKFFVNNNSEDQQVATSSADQSLQSTLLPALLSKRDALTRSSSNITEEDLARKIPPTIKEEQTAPPPSTKQQPKSSQLREMNFWSPTSM